AHWSIGASAQAGRISNPGSFKISGATLHISDADEHLGRFILATKQIPRDPGFVVTSNSAIDLFGNNSRLSFADSSGQTCDPGTTLTIYNWSGNPSGGGGEQLKFGNSSSGLTPAQLSKITFLFGEPPVSYPAKL